MAVVLTALGAFVVWVVSFFVFKSDFVAHVQHEAATQAWNQYGFAANRLEYLDDKNAECDSKRMVAPKLAPVDAAICSRYEAKLKTKVQEAADLKTKASEASKETPK
jgi:hypothetical protein